MKQKIVKVISFALFMIFLCTGFSVYAEDNTGLNNTLTEDVSAEKTPITLKIEKYDTTSVKLKWNMDDSLATYKLLCAESKNGQYKEVVSNKSEAEQMEYIHKKRKLGKTYYYKVQMIVDGQVVKESSVVSIKLQLDTPTKVKAVRTSKNQLKVSWKKVSGATSYSVYRSTKKNGKYIKIATVKKTFYTDSTVKSGRAYYYKICANKATSAAAKSEQSNAKAGYTKPAQPVVQGEYTSDYVKLTWEKVEGASKYYIYKKKSDGSYGKVAETKKLYYKDTATIEKKYNTYKVAAVYRADKKNIQGNFSEVVKVFGSKIDPNKKMIALTFDDGPGPYTTTIVNCLKKYDARATFFVVGVQVGKYPDALKAAYDSGCEIGNHSYSHPILTRLNYAGIRTELIKTDEKVKNITGQSTIIMRPPGGAVNSTVKMAVGKPIIQWSIDTLDWKTRSKAQTVKTVMSQVEDGDIILMHDIHKPTMEAALELIPRLKKEGYQLVTVSELAEYRGYTLQNGNAYFSLDKK